jgi:hypothetical protein
MADFSDLAGLRTNEPVMQRVAVAMVAGTRSMLTATPLDPTQASFARRIAANSREAAETYFVAVLTSAAIIAKLGAPTTITDADLVASVAEIAAGLAQP